jgi:hypothetical protein
MVGSDAPGEIGVQAAARQQWRVAIDMAILKRMQLVDHAGIAGDHAGKVHHLGQAVHLRMVAEGQKVRDLQPRAGGPRTPSPARRTTGLTRMSMTACSAQSRK